MHQFFRRKKWQVVSISIDNMTNEPIVLSVQFLLIFFKTGVIYTSQYPPRKDGMKHYFMFLI